MEESNSSNLFWVEPSTSSTRSVRSKQRQKVMQTVGLRRKSGPKHQHPNSRQLPVFTAHRDAAASSEVTSSQNRTEISGKDVVSPNETCRMWLGSSAPHSGITAPHPTILVEANLDFADMSSLASLEVGRYTGQRLMERPKGIVQFLRGTAWSYCRYVPQFYSSSTLIHDATNCVIARVKSLLDSGFSRVKWEQLALACYSNALSQLQSALNASSQALTTEVLCASQILSLYELLNSRRDKAWIKHAAGASSIIELRGPSSYITDFEKSLFMSHIGPIITEAILENQSCFLENPAWISVLRSIVSDDAQVPERSTTLVSLIIILLSIPRLFRDTTEAICSQNPPSDTRAAELITRSESLRLDLRNWYAAHIGPDTKPVVGVNQELEDGYYKLLVLFYLCSIYSSRIITCLYWVGTQEIEKLEEESQQFARTIVSFSGRETSLQSSLVLAQKLPIAEATIQTGDEWKQACLKQDVDNGGLFRMPAPIFRQWCTLFGRKFS